MRVLSDFDNLSELNYNNNDNFLSTAPIPSNEFIEFPHNSYHSINPKSAPLKNFRINPYCLPPFITNNNSLVGIKCLDFIIE